MRISDWSSDVCSSDLVDGCVSHSADFVRIADHYRHIGHARGRRRRARHWSCFALTIQTAATGQQQRRPGHQAPALNDRFHPPATPQIMRKNWNNYSPISHDSYRSANKLSGRGRRVRAKRSEEHTSELQSLMRISYAVFCLKKKKKT